MLFSGNKPTKTVRIGVPAARGRDAIIHTDAVGLLRLDQFTLIIEEPAICLRRDLPQDPRQTDSRIIGGRAYGCLALTMGYQGVFAVDDIKERDACMHAAKIYSQDRISARRCHSSASELHQKADAFDEYG